MSRNKTVEYKLTKDGVKVKKPKSIITEVGGKYFVIKPSNPMYSIVSYYGNVVGYI